MTCEAAVNEFTQDPGAYLDYKVDWAALTNGTGESDWLAAGETISSTTVTADTGITADAGTITDTNTSVTIWVSGGTATIDYNIVCAIVTSAGRKDERTIIIKVRQR